MVLGEHEMMLDGRFHRHAPLAGTRGPGLPAVPSLEQALGQQETPYSHAAMIPISRQQLVGVG